MNSVISFTDIEAVQVSKSGRSGAALAELSHEGFEIARGFIVTSEVFNEFLRNHDVAVAWTDFHTTSQEKKAKPAALEKLLDAMSTARLMWEHEMEIITRFREMDGMLALHVSTISGRVEKSTHAFTEAGLFESIKTLWGKWASKATVDELHDEPPAVVVQEVIEAESTVQLQRKKDGFELRTVFGQPEGLFDPEIGADRYHFNFSLEMTNFSEKAQAFQHVPLEDSFERIEVFEDFQKDPKITQEVLDALIEHMSFMLERPEIEDIIAVIVEDKPVISDIVVTPLAEKLPLVLDQRQKSHTLIPEIHAEPAAAPLPVATPSAVEGAEATEPPLTIITPAPQQLRTKLFIKVSDLSQLDTLDRRDFQGILLAGGWHQGFAGLLDELKPRFAELTRKFQGIKFIIQLPTDPELRTQIMRAAEGIPCNFLLPPTRTVDELHKISMGLRKSGQPKLWAQVAYPSNLFFIERTVPEVDAISADLETLAIHLVGKGHETSHTPKYDSHSMQEAISHLIEKAHVGGADLSVHRPDFSMAPALLEHLIRHNVDILCVSPGEFETVKHIVGSVEKRMLQERG